MSQGNLPTPVMGAFGCSGDALILDVEMVLRTVRTHDNKTITSAPIVDCEIASRLQERSSQGCRYSKPKDGDLLWIPSSTQRWGPILSLAYTLPDDSPLQIPTYPCDI